MNKSNHENRIAKGPNISNREHPYLEYSETEIKMLDIGEALLISEPKIRFTVPIRVTHCPEYLATKTKIDCGLS